MLAIMLASYGAGNCGGMLDGETVLSDAETADYWWSRLTEEERSAWLRRLRAPMFRMHGEAAYMRRMAEI
jgi:acyl-CoA reductase-like NAD-dependent aldehyde dehydrogenase